VALAITMPKFLFNPFFWATVAGLIGISLLAWQYWINKMMRDRKQAEDALLNAQIRDRAGFWDESVEQTSNRRIRLRRTGASVQLHYRLSDGSPRLPAVVLDRSVGGLRLNLDDEIPVGTYLFLLPDQAPSGVPWAEAKVVWCKPVVGGHELGCEFVDSVPWNVLLLFG
jgi:hypothetical protein